MQRIIDGLSPNVKLILCGSYISVMKELVEEDNPLFGRFTQVIDVKEYDYYDASKFYPELDVRSKIERYAVFGGSPYILSNPEQDLTLGEMLVEKLLPETSIFHIYVESIVLQEIRKNYDVRILERIGNRRTPEMTMVRTPAGTKVPTITETRIITRPAPAATPATVPAAAPTTVPGAPERETSTTFSPGWRSCSPRCLP